jgi:glycosyltransferase involved in cell wall biosynthesis
MKVLLLANEPVDHAIAFANGIAPYAEVSMLAPENRFANLRRWINPDIDLELIDWPRMRSLRNPVFLWQLTQKIRARRPMIVHLLSNTALWLNAAVPFWRTAPLVTTVHDVTLHPGDRDTGRIPSWGPRLVARQSADLIVHGPDLAQEASRAFSKTLDRVHVLQHPAIRRYADLARIERMSPPTPDGLFRVLMFGRIFAYKGLDTLVRAEQLLADRIPGLRIVIAGRGDHPGKLRFLMGRPDRYDIRHRFIDDTETARIFTDADVIVLPYAEASQSGVLHVAATFGRPVVATDVGELGTTVRTNSLGIVVPPRDPARLADALERLAVEISLSRKLGAAARAWSLSENAPETVGVDAVALYRRILQRDSAAVRKVVSGADAVDCPKQVEREHF